MRLLLVIAFIVVPLVELAIIIQVGELIGAAWTILLLLAVALALFPGKETAFELIYRPRFERVLHARWPHEMPTELGLSFVLGEPTRGDR